VADGMIQEVVKNSRKKATGKTIKEDQVDASDGLPVAGETNFMLHARNIFNVVLGPSLPDRFDKIKSTAKGYRSEKNMAKEEITGALKLCSYHFLTNDRLVIPPEGPHVAPERKGRHPKAGSKPKLIQADNGALLY
jgi:hypothetical protein